MRTSRRLSTPAAFVLLALAVFVTPAIIVSVLATTADAAPQKHHLGEPWEQPIDRGVIDQRASARRGTAPKQLIERALRAVRRDDSVTKLYLLARAYGVSAQFHRARAEKTTSAATKQRAMRSAHDDHRTAMDTYRDVIRRAPRCYYAYHDMGVLTLQADPKATRLAFDSFSAGYRINDRYTPTVRQLVKLYLAGKQFGVAVPLLQALVAQDPSDDEARLRLVAAYVSLQKHDLADAELERLIRKNPADLRPINLRADADLKRGRWARAKSGYARIARANPGSPLGYVGLINVVNAESKATGKRDYKTYLYALKGLYRTLREEARRAEVLAEIRRTEHRQANPDGDAGQGPPTTAQLLHGLKSPEAQDRLRSVVLLMGREEEPTAAVVRALAQRLSAAVEPSPPVRAAVIAGLGMRTGSRLAPLLRMSLGDPDVRVRSQTVDTLVGIARLDRRVQGAVVAVLGLLVADREVELAAAARSGILILTRTRLAGITEESTDAARRMAFQSWWASDVGSEIQITSLDSYHEFGDRTPHTTLLPYLDAKDFFVWRAAYQALGRSAAGVRDPSWKAWYAARPQFGPERLQKAQWAALKGEMAGWLARRPSR